MLSEISFEDFSRDEDIGIFDDRESVMVGLLGLTNGVGKKQLQKLMFLSSVANNIILPFRFEKHFYGPFSRDIEETVGLLKEKGLVEFSSEPVYTALRETRKLTEEGRRVFSGGMQLFSDSVKELVSSYSEDDGVVYAKVLEKVCYDEFYLVKDENDEWRNSVRSKVQDILSLLSDRVEAVSRMELDERQSLILMAFDYMKNLLNRLLDGEMDQVVRGVLIKKSEEYVEKWGEIMLLDREKGSRDEFNKILSDEKRIFKFVNGWASFYGVCDSVFDFEFEKE